ncbi:hypothetical protein [Streptomyces shenzhenensis]|uniref:hypothetical protein n=1 Tax=Streptomyces shenzhenensis TaxID=943815 RepID=UPI0027E58432|nr:hypothetical protein [Streptomyces shenzhenensis]
MSHAKREGSRGLVSLLMDAPEEAVSDEAASTLGRCCMALMSDLISQWTFDPTTAPDGKALTEGLRQTVEAATRK